MNIPNDLRATLYMGANIPTGGKVNDLEFLSFLEESVTPRFKGFTVRETLGYWEGEPERSRELVILTEASTPQFEANVRGIAEQYKTRFGQDSVMVSFEALDVVWNVWPHKPAKKSILEGVVDQYRHDCDLPNA